MILDEFLHLIPLLRCQDGAQRLEFLLTERFLPSRWETNFSVNRSRMPRISVR